MAMRCKRDTGSKVSTSRTEEDLRVRRTRTALREALLDILSTRPFEQVTVRELAARATVNRATFYRHYRDKEELAVSIFETAIDDLLVAAGPPPPDFTTLEPSRPPEAWVALFRHVRDHAPLYRALLCARTWAWLHAVVRQKLSAVVQERIAAVGGPRRSPLVPTELGLAMMSSALVGALAWWLDGNLEHEPEVVAAWVLGFAAQGYLRAVGFEARNA